MESLNLRRNVEQISFMADKSPPCGFRCLSESAWRLIAINEIAFLLIPWGKRREDDKAVNRQCFIVQGRAFLCSAVVIVAT